MHRDRCAIRFIVAGIDSFPAATIERA